MDLTMNTNEPKMSYLDALKKFPGKKMSEPSFSIKGIVYLLDVNLDINSQIDKIATSVHGYTNVNIEINKSISFYFIINLIKRKISNKNVNISVVCQPYNITGLYRSNKNKYVIIQCCGNLRVYINDKYIDTSKDRIIMDERNIDRDFILDIFRIFDNVKFYDWQDSIDDFYIGRSGAMYGAPSGNYKRIKKNIIQIESYPCCCNYTGGETLFDISTNESTYHSITEE